jgi:tetratricopeptide (TPR) repeat protein
VDLETTIASLRQRLNENPEDADAAVQLGNLCYDQHDAPQAVMYYLIALNIDPGQPGVRTDMGTMLWRTGNVGLAEQAFRRVIAEHPDFGNAYVNLGHLLQRAKNDSARAKEVWRTLIQNHPQSAAAVEAGRLLVAEH